MVMGHYATALIPWAYQSNRNLAPFWFILLATQILDFIMIGLVLIGVETIEPSAFLDASFKEMAVDMTYSHDILPVIVLTTVFSGLTYAMFRSGRLALIVAGLLLLHEAMDLLVGFEHFWFGIPSNPEEAGAFGFGLYNSHPFLGILFEAVICIGLLVWYTKKRAEQGQALSRQSSVTLWCVLVGFTGFLLLMANQSLRSLFF